MKILQHMKYVAGILAMVTTLGTSPVLAVEGIPAIADCGGSNFAIGFLPNPATCTYPNVGTFVDDDGDPVYLTQHSSGSLIYKDDQKAVFMTAAHVLFPGAELKSYFLTFAPQPSIPFELPVLLFGRDSGRLKPASAWNDLIPVARINGLNAFRAHPLRNPKWGRTFVENDVELVFMDMTDPIVAHLLAGVTPLKLASTGLLNNYTPSQLRTLDFTVVGYSKLVPSGATNTAPEPGQFDKVAGQHNRKYGPLTIYGTSPWVIKTEEKIINEQTISCQGDSGGPLLLHLGDKAYIVGMVSGGQGCGQTASSWYVRTDIPDNVKFVDCAINPVLSIAQSLDCIDNLSF